MTPREPKYLVDRAAEEVGAWHDALRAIVHSVIVHPVPKGAPMQIEVFGQTLRANGRRRVGKGGCGGTIWCL